jgi:hypothetical protein
MTILQEAHTAMSSLLHSRSTRQQTQGRMPSAESKERLRGGKKSRFVVVCICFLRLEKQRHNTENSKQIFPEKELRGLSPNFHIHVSVSDLYIPTIDLAILVLENMWTDPGNV